MGLSRRNFLQQTGLALLTLGVSDILLPDSSLAAPATEDYRQALSAPTSRKLALLVGINRYPKSKPLGGCAVDVELQRELLVRRFGFNPSDVLVLTNQQATREDIETAFVEHLIEQAKEGDTVVFHFSGYGSRVKRSPLGQKAEEVVAPRWESSLLPVDGIISTKGAPVGNELLLSTLSLLARSLATQRVTMVLDTSYTRSEQFLQGNLRSRSSLASPAERPNPQELAFQEQLKSRRKFPTHPSERLPIPGVLLAAAREGQIAAEQQWDGFSAGLFTYALAQSLWQMIPPSPIYITLARTAEKMAPFASQRPQLTQTNRLRKFPPSYFLAPSVPLSAEGVAIAVEDNGKTAQLHLAGLPAAVWAHYQPHSRLSLASESLPTVDFGASQPQVKIRSRDGLTATATLVSSTAPPTYTLAPGQLFQEFIRFLPRDLGLTVALTAELPRIERVDATSAFSNMAAVSSVAIAGEQAADCLFGQALRGQGRVAETTDSEPPNSPGYELFSLDRVPIPQTQGENGEAVKSAVNRLQPHFEMLLAAKLWRLTTNAESSRLGVRATLAALEPEGKPLLQRATLRSRRLPRGSQSLAPRNSATIGSLTAIPRGTPMHYKIENFSDRPLYLMLLGLNAGGRAIALYAPQLDRSTNTSTLTAPLISPGETLTIPKNSRSLDWTISDTLGVVEMHLICSQAPFTKTLATLAALSYPNSKGERLIELRNPLAVARSLLQDLHAASAVSPDMTNAATDSYALDVNCWATLPFIYQTIETEQHPPNTPT